MQYYPVSRIVSSVWTSSEKSYYLGIGLSAGKEASFASRITSSSGKDDQECTGHFRIDACKLLPGTENGFKVLIFVL